MPCIRLWLRGAAVAAFFVASLLVVAPGVQVANAASAAPQLHVSGNRLVDASSQTVVLHGVNRSGGEFACVQGWGIWDGPMDQASIDAMKGWGINSVRVPLNEACWNAESYVVNSAYRGATYQQAVVDYVNLLNQNGLVAILDLHWSDGTYTGYSSGCASTQAVCQKPLPDAAQAVPFWSSVAATFKGNDAVIFDLFNEPYPERATGSEASGWQCWLNGGTCSGIPYSVAGMQQLVNAVRVAGAGNVIALGGLEYSNDLTAWLTHKPTDSSNNLMAAWHSYDSNTCNSSSCWNSQIAPVVAQVPLLVGELGESDCGASYIDPLMTWLDSQGASYLAWTWNNWDCSSGPSLISDYTGTATAYGAGYKAHLLAVSGPAPLDHLILSPADGTIAAGGAQVYAAEGYDASNNDLGPVIGGTTLSIAGGSCINIAHTCTSTVPGDHTVTGTDGTATGTATLHVNATAPGKPTGVTATAGNGSALVAWTAPVDNGGSPITGYTVTSSGDAKTCTTSATSCTVSGLTSGQPYTFTVTATNAAGTGPASDPSSSVTVSLIGATYHALTPARVLDSRDGYWIGLSGAFSSHVARTFTVSGHGGVPSNAIAVTGNLTVTDQTALGYLYMGLNAMNNPTSSTLNFPLGDDRANAVTVALGAGGTLSVTYVAAPGASAQVIFDVTGYFTPDSTGATYHALTPARVLDSRDGYWIGLSGAFSSHVARTFTVSGHGGVPSNAIAVTGNLTVTGQTALGYLYMGPNAMNNPTSSTLNFPLGDDRANAVTVALGAGGTLSVTYVAVPGATAQVIFDVTGYFIPDSTGATYVAVTPARVLDSRDGYWIGLSGASSSHVARTFTVAGRGGVPSNAIAVTGNLTVTGQTALGYLYVGPNATNNPTSSTLNFPLGDDRANAVTVALGAGGTLSVTYVAVPGASAQVIFDVTGYFVK